jgi:undecaprenyl-diphosphatase
MTYFQAVVLGLFQGATEFLPISSTAHIYLADKIIFGKDSGAAFTAIIQLGTLLAAIIYFRKDILNILFRRRSDENEDGADQRLLLPIAVGTLPIVIAGLLLKDKVETGFRGPYVVAGGMIFFAVLLALAEKLYRARKEMGEIGLIDGLVVGLAQMFAIIPGASRSGTSITGALFLGIERSTAARFSFLLSLPAIFGAAVYEMRHLIGRDAAQLKALQPGPLVVATLVSFVVGYVSIDWLLKFLRRSPTYGFVVYRIVVGIVILVMAMSGSIR